MNFIRTLKKGAAEAVSSYKLLVIIWLTTMLTVLLVAVPLKSALKSIFGNSFSVERLKDGFDLGLTGDMGESFRQLMASTVSGGLLLALAGFLLYTFFAGGLFTRFTTAHGDLKLSAFMKASAHNFVPFLKIALLICAIIAVFTMLIVGIPAGVNVALAQKSGPIPKLMILPYIIWALAMPVWLSVVDYSRRWIAATGSPKVFRALGAGFKALKEKFWLSYIIVLVIVVLNVVFLFASLWFAGWSMPDKGVMIFLFFLATQLLFLVRLFMKAWRYASVSQLAVGWKV
jgi:hypothetical protein